MKTIKLLLLFVFVSPALYGQINQLPRPSGDIPVGIEYLSFTDLNRKELFDDSLKSYRDITIKVWYPADIKTNYEPYLENSDFVINNLQFSEIYRTLKTFASKEVPVSKSEKIFPVLIFSHGWGEHFSQNSILMQELASHGYIIFSVAHHFECKFTFYPDGRILTLNTTGKRFSKLMQEQQNPDAFAIFQKMATAKTNEERLSVFTESNKIMPTLLKESPAYWAGDIKFLINQLVNINKSDLILKGRLDLNRIGIFGMSMGGVATNEICLTDNRVKAGVNIDGGLNGTLAEKVMNVPFMFINSQRYLGYGELFSGRSDGPCYSVTVPNSDHYNFTDYALFPNPSTSMLGSIDPKMPIEIMNTYILAFFDKYLKYKNSISLSDLAQKYDVEFFTNNKN
jgi:hypothetical protein